MAKRTFVYVDGFNFYYGAVRKGPYKWLDLVALSEKLMEGYEIRKLKYFTAAVSGFGDPGKPTRQHVFWRALKEINKKRIEIIKGAFRTDPKDVPIACRQKGGRYFPSEQSIKVMRTIEKGSDVNLAVHLVNDAWKDLYDAALIVSNDSDLAEALSIVKNECNKAIFLANPFGWKKTGVALKLLKLEPRIRKIREIDLASSQLPDPIPGTKIHKPPGW